jgi:protein-L-isoaspartate(D-aspartate) O-methyltransferase
MKDKREQMVYELKKKYGIKSPDILSIMLQIPRHKFVDKKYKDIAYNDGPVSIGYGQTMSQPYTVAFMTDLLDLDGDEKILEIGTGSGYQAAILSKLAKEVYTMEIVKELADKAKKILKKLGYKNVHVKASTGEHGWKSNAPFDAIMVTAGVKGKVPQELFDQLKIGGVLVAPVGGTFGQRMMRYRKLKDGKTKRRKNKKTKEQRNSKDYRIEEEIFGSFRFVPFVEEDSG